MRFIVLIYCTFSVTAFANTWRVTNVSCQTGKVKEGYFLRPGAEVSDRIQEYHPLIISHEHGTAIDAVFIDDPRDPDKACENSERPTLLTISLMKLQ